MLKHAEEGSVLVIYLGFLIEETLDGLRVSVGSVVISPSLRDKSSETVYSRPRKGPVL